MFRNMLRNQKVLMAIGFLVLVALIWFLGPWLGLKSAEARFGWIFAVMLVWVAILLVGKALSERAAGLLEGVLRKQGDDAVMAASPEKRAEVAALRTRLLDAIETLKKSNIGKTRGKAALYELPWYMVIGHPSAGKSSAIINSGLTFPLGEKGGAGIQGVGGTRNCDWFFSTEGVLLDTAGRYSTQREDRQEWLEFLKLLRRHRPKAPLNGIIVAISLPELAKHKTEAFASYVRQVRERINEVDDAFGVKLPVYLVLTKIDLLGGFGQFFEVLPEEERHRVWGATLSHEQAGDFDASRVVGQHFELLYRGLVQSGNEQLANNRGSSSNASLFAFPIEFHAIKEGVCHFVELLFEDDPYHTKPLLRGFYLTSALQEGVPRIAAGARVSAQFELSRSGFEVTQPPSGHSYFLRELFRRVIFEDQFLVGRQTRPSVGKLRLAGIVGGLVLASLLVGSWTWSFVGNQKLLETANSEMATATQLLRSQSLADQLKGLQVLQLRIEQLYGYRRDGSPWGLGFGLYRGNEVETVLRREYFAGVKRLLLQPVAANLEARLASLSVPAADQRQFPSAAPLPVQDGLQRVAASSNQILANRPRDAREALAQMQRKESGGDVAPSDGERAAGEQKRLEEGYNALKTYLMLHFQERMEVGHLSDQLPRYWRPWLESRSNGQLHPEVVRSAERIVGFYLSQLQEPDLPLIDNRQETVEASRQILRSALKRLSAKERVYNELKARGNTQFPAMTVARLLNNKDADLFTASYAVPGSFTREAWDKYFQNAIAEASRGEVKGDDWVLAASLADDLSRDGDVERNRRALEAMYQADYASEWKKFLQGISVKEFASLEEAQVLIGRLGDAQKSPLRTIIVRASQETAWDNPSELAKRLESAKSTVIEKTERFINGRSGDGSNDGGRFGEVGGQFSVLPSLAGNGEAAGPLLADYLAHLAKLRIRLATIAASDEPGAGSRQLMQQTLSGSGSELAETLQVVDVAILGATGEDTREYLRPLLVRPLINSYAALLPPTEKEINKAWSSQVYGTWSSLSRKYPFADSSNEASMAEMGKFFKPGDGILSRFITQQIGSLAVLRGETLVPKTWANLGIRFSPAFLSGAGKLMNVSTSFQEGDGSKFELQPVPTPGLSEILIEIDGQPLRYRNGPQIWTTFSWPSPTNVQGARLQVISNSGTNAEVANFSGRMGLMRLLAMAKVTDASGQGGQLMWRSSAKDDGSTVRFNFHPVSGTNPLALASLRRLVLPESITQ